MAGGGAALLRGRGRAGAPAGRAAADGFRAAGGQGGAGVRRHGRDRFHNRPAADPGHAPGGVLPRGRRSAPWRGPCGIECYQPYPGERFRDAMRPTRNLRLNVLAWAACGALAACGGARAPGTVTGAVRPAVPDSAAPQMASFGAAITRAAPDSAAAQHVRDRLHRALARSDSLQPRPDTVVTAVKPQEVA